ncbi:hypothetical protein [Nitratireductor sp. StC3]|uniref:DUF6950 family protein n=1 Tax=Nitratireductor sp. StC3 TaxID=2126741 RepID=UPI0011B25EF8|nr:hypothetical protein [Nitratireductor sp. StC3]
MTSLSAEARDRLERLRAMAERLKGKPCEWGVDDCSTMPAQWVAETTGKEFDWPAYSTKEEAIELTEAWGGLVNIWDHVARQIGLKAVFGEPEPGDVGVIQSDQGPVGGIWLPNHVIMRRAEMGVRVHWVRPYTVRSVDGEPTKIPLILKTWRVV